MTRPHRLLAFLALIPTTAFAAPDLDGAAIDVCHCLKAPYAKMTEIISTLSSAQNRGDMSQMQLAQSEMMETMEASTGCFDELTRKYPAINRDKQLQKQVMQRADQQCPNPAIAMFGGQRPPQ